MMSIRTISSGSIQGRPILGNRERARKAPTISRERQKSSEPGDRPDLPHQDETNKAAPLGRDRAVPSSLASIANRMTTTESPFLKSINDFCNKIGTKLTYRTVDPFVRLRGKTDMPKMTRTGDARATHFCC